LSFVWRKLAARCWLIVLILAGAAWTASPGADERQGVAGTTRHVLIVSVDGMKPESYTDPDAHGLKVPTLREIVRNGAYSDGVVPVMPTVTYPSHTSMATGTNPGTHGIISNTAFDPLGKNAAGWWWYEEDIRVPTIWQLAHEHGLRTALVHWPVTAGAQADLNVPEYWRAQVPEDLKLLRALSMPPGVLGDVAKEYADFSAGILPPDQTDGAFTDIACYAIEKIRPNLLMLHIPNADHWQHEKGPFSAEGNAAIENADAQIARLIASARKVGIWNDTVLVVVSDHGFASISKELRPGVLLREHGLVTLDAQNKPTDWKASLVVSGGSAFIYVKDQDDEKTRRAVLDVFQPLAGVTASGIRRVATHDQVVAMGGDPQAFLALEAADGYGFAAGYTGNAIQPSKGAGTHGYFPDRPEMRSSLLIYGPAIHAGKMQNARMIDIGPTVAEWLGLELTKAEGRPMMLPAADTSPVSTR
jgi:predicted AlkP superfamily pyrophosphatase or phosphodiesterase